MYATAAKVQQLDFYTRLNKDFRSDLYWCTFLMSWNGLSLLRSTSAKADFCIQTDVSGSWGSRAYFHGRWFQLPWDKTWQHMGIMAKELLPIVISTAIWGPSLSGHKVLYQCDNSSVVAEIRKGSARDTIVMYLLRSLWFFTAHYDVDLICEHIAGVANNTADHLSRNNNSLFFSQNPDASLLPIPLPTPLLQITNIQGPDRTSAHFSQYSFLPTYKLYSTGIQQYLSFCQGINRTPHLLPNSYYCYLLHTSLKANYPSRFTYLHCVAFTLPQAS